MENGQYNASASVRAIMYPEWARVAGFPETYTGLEANHPGSVSLYCDGHVRYCTNTIVAPLWREFTPNWKD
jgi:prepilin-type processing-associated H-X9-DG protein